MTGVLATVAVFVVTAYAACRTAGYLWRSRRPAPDVVMPCRSHVRRVSPRCSSVGSPVSPGGVDPADIPPSLALDAYSTLAGGTELEARIETARRRIAQDRTFGDAGLRRRDPDPIIRDVAAYLAHPSQQEPRP